MSPGKSCQGLEIEHGGGVGKIFVQEKAVRAHAHDQQEGAVEQQVWRLVESSKRCIQALWRIGLDVKQGLENGLADTEVIFVGLSITISTSFHERNKFYFSSSIADTLCRRAAAHSLCLVPLWCRSDC